MWLVHEDNWAAFVEAGSTSATGGADSEPPGKPDVAIGMTLKEGYEKIKSAFKSALGVDVNPGGTKTCTIIVSGNHNTVTGNCTQ
jgi:hypothetical protein